MSFGNPVRGTIRTKPTVAGWLLTQEFGCTGFPWEPSGFGCAHYHRGIDIAWTSGRCGDDVLAAAAGTVEWSGPLNNGDQAIVLRHASGLATGYSHLQSRKVGAGQKVTRGQEIGKVGRTGLATGCHLHFAVKSGFPASGDVNDFYLDAYSVPPGGKGKWRDPWPLLEQNQPDPKTVRPINESGIRIRAKALVNGKAYAETDLPDIVRADGKNLGRVLTARKWGGTVTGGSYEIGGKTGNRWERIYLDGAYRYIASPLAVVS